jgi:Zn-finger nucleic acid-binding protein
VSTVRERVCPACGGEFVDTLDMDRDAVTAIDREGYCYVSLHHLDLKAIRFDLAPEDNLWCNGTSLDRITKLLQDLSE